MVRIDKIHDNDFSKILGYTLFIFTERAKYNGKSAFRVRLRHLLAPFIKNYFDQVFLCISKTRN